LVVITPAAGFVALPGALILGLAAGMLCYVAVVFVKYALGYDDSLDAFGVHGVAGVLGTLGTGLFAAPFVTAPFGMNGGAGFSGLFYGNPASWGVQAQATLVSVVWAFGMSFAIFALLKATIGIRVSEKDEAIGLDITQHNEKAYTLIE
jgi:Amt family ammonium transporter